MMDDLRVKQALHAYVEANEPPFPLTANGLISEGRRRQRWRLGLGLGGGAATTSLVVFSTLALIPVTGGAGQFPGGCDWELPVAQLPAAPTPTGFPDPGFRFTPTPTPGPVESPVLSTAEPTGAPPSPTVHPDPTGASALPTLFPTPPVPSGPPEGALPGEVDKVRLDEMSCFLKRRMVELRPHASFLPPSAPPMHVVRSVELSVRQRAWVAVYRAGAFVIEDSLTCLVSVTVYPSGGDLTGPAEEVTFPSGARGWIHRSDWETAVAVVKEFSTVLVTFEAKALTVEQAMELADAPQLDLHR